MFLDGLHHYIAFHYPNIGTALSDGTRVSKFQYADHVTLSACDPSHLQALIDCTVQFCEDVDLRIIPDENTILAFPASSPVSAWSCDGVPVYRVDSATYLGLTVHAKHGLLSSCASREQKMWAAWAALQRKYAGLDCGVSLGLLARLHQACICPVASYGCELWGLRDMPSRLAASRRKLCMGHVHMLRQISGLWKSNPRRQRF